MLVAYGKKGYGIYEWYEFNNCIPLKNSDENVSFTLLKDIDFDCLPSLYGILTVNSLLENMKDMKNSLLKHNSEDIFAAIDCYHYEEDYDITESIIDNYLFYVPKVSFRKYLKDHNYGEILPEGKLSKDDIFVRFNDDEAKENNIVDIIPNKDTNFNDFKEKLSDVIQVVNNMQYD